MPNALHLMLCKQEQACCCGCRFQLLMKNLAGILQEYIEKERLSNPHFLLRRVEANNQYLQSRVSFLDALLAHR